MQITKAQIDTVFDKAAVPADYVAGLYRLVIPNWNIVKKIDGYPRCGKALSDCLWHKSIEFDRDYVKRTGENYLPGGMWLNYGFSSDAENLGNWELALDPAIITYEEEVQDVLGNNDR